MSETELSVWWLVIGTALGFGLGWLRGHLDGTRWARHLFTTDNPPVSETL